MGGGRRKSRICSSITILLGTSEEREYLNRFSVPAVFATQQHFSQLEIQVIVDGQSRIARGRDGKGNSMIFDTLMSRCRHNAERQVPLRSLQKHEKSCAENPHQCRYARRRRETQNGASLPTQTPQTDFCVPGATGCLAPKANYTYDLSLSEGMRLNTRRLDKSIERLTKVYSQVSSNLLRLGGFIVI
jgi:hypothetical protein